jgi:hypothetical protein
MQSDLHSMAQHRVCMTQWIRSVFWPAKTAGCNPCTTVALPGTISHNANKRHCCQADSTALRLFRVALQQVPDGLAAQGRLQAVCRAPGLLNDYSNEYLLLVGTSLLPTFCSLELLSLHVLLDSLH